MIYKSLPSMRMQAAIFFYVPHQDVLRKNIYIYKFHNLYLLMLCLLLFVFCATLH